MSGTQNHLPFFTPGRNVGLERPAVVETNDTGASSLSERIELLDEETRSCWRRVDELEDEEASLNHRLMRLEKIRRGERLEILALEQACKAAEMAMIQAQEEGANFDAKAQVLESLAQDAAADAAAATDAASAAMESYQQGASATLSPTNGGGNAGVSGEQGKPPRLEGFTALSAVLKEMPAHDEKREHLASMLHQTEIQTQSEIAEASRSAAELRLSIKRKDAERFPLEHEITALREEQARMTSEDEVQARMVRARQVGEGLRGRLQHANEKLASVRGALAQGSSKHMEEEEQKSLQLMQGIAEAKACLRWQEKNSETSASWSRNSASRGGGGGGAGDGGRLSLVPTSSHPRL